MIISNSTLLILHFWNSKMKDTIRTQALLYFRNLKKAMGLYLYNLAMALLKLIVSVGALFSPKLKKGKVGRKGIFEKIAKDKQKIGNRKVVWLHCASLGEYEQGKPLAEAFLKKYPNFCLIISFFSPSGYELRKQNPLTPYVYYLPLDSQKNAQKWVATFQPTIVFFVRYEFWYHYLKVLKDQKTPTCFISSVIPERYFLFHPFFSFLKEAVKEAIFFTQDPSSALRLKEQGIRNSNFTGDTRVDRVQQTASSCKHFPKIAEFIGKERAFVFGSVWKDDINLIAPTLEKMDLNGVKLMIAPHEITQTQIAHIQKMLPYSTCLYSEYDAAMKDKKVLIIDCIGILAQVYQYANWAFVGGGLHNALHNILEPAAFGIPIIFGAHKKLYRKYPESHQLQEVGGAFSADTASSLYTQLQPLFTDEHVYKSAQEKVRYYMQEQAGGTDKVMSYLRSHLDI